MKTGTITNMPFSTFDYLHRKWEFYKNMNKYKIQIIKFLSFNSHCMLINSSRVRGSLPPFNYLRIVRRKTDTGNFKSHVHHCCYTLHLSLLWLDKGYKL